MIPATWSLAARICAPLLVLAAVAALVWGYGQRRYLAGEAAAHFKIQAESLKTAEANARETERRITTIEEARRVAELRMHQALSDAAAAAAAGGRLQHQLDAFTRAARASTAGRCQAAGDPIGVLADVLSRCDAQQGFLAKYADAAREAGRLCERSYDALSHGQPQPP